MSPLRTFAFGASGQNRWLAGWFPTPGTEGVLVVGDGSGVSARPARLQTGAEHGDWHVSAADAEVQISPTSPEAVVSGATGPVDGFEQAADCSGTIDGAAVAAPGRRGERPDGGEVQRSDSVREVAAWFDGGEVVTVTAVRPRKAKGHEQDSVHAAVVEPDGFAPVIDPRLSTTYTANGRTRRVGLELWSEDEDAPALRLTAEALGPGGTVSSAGWELTVDRLAAHRRGRDGAGVYLLARAGE